MKKYTVWFTKSIDVSVSVQARNEEEAREKAENLFFVKLNEEQRHNNEQIDYQYGDYDFAYIDKEEDE